MSKASCCGSTSEAAAKAKAFAQDVETALAQGRLTAVSVVAAVLAKTGVGWAVHGGAGVGRGLWGHMAAVQGRCLRLCSMLAGTHLRLGVIGGRGLG